MVHFSKINLNVIERVYIGKVKIKRNVNKKYSLHWNEL